MIPTLTMTLKTTFQQNFSIHRVLASIKAILAIHTDAEQISNIALFHNNAYIPLLLIDTVVVTHDDNTIDY